jgi:hypothetical protein
MSRHLVVTITHHGLGHFAQTAPVLNALRRRLPQLRLTLVTTIPEAKLRERIEGEFSLQERALDFGFVMRDALNIDAARSARAYRDLHEQWDARVAEEAQWLACLQADAVLANVAYLPLAAAGALGLPAFAMSSLNWADLFAHSYAGEAWSPAIHAQMLAADRCARLFIRLIPAMPMPDLPLVRAVGPVARVGRRRRAELMARLGGQEGERLVAVMFGGVEKRLPMETWPLGPDIRWLVPQSWQIRHPRVHALEPLLWDYTDIIASVDAVIGKPGYGTFVEAACNDTPTLYALRNDWPEQAWLVDWLKQHARCLDVDLAALESGDVRDGLAQLWRQAPVPVPPATGADEAAALLARHLGYIP